MMIRLFILFSLLCSSLSFAEAGRSALDLEREIEMRLTPIVKGADANSIFYIRVTPQTSKLSLPMTSFVVRDLPQEDANGRIRIQKLEVIILTRTGKFPESGLQLITEFTKSYGVKPEITLQTLPNEFALSKMIDENEEVKTLAKNERDIKKRSPASADPALGSSNNDSQNFKDLGDPRLSVLDPLLKSPRLMLAAGLCLLTFFVVSMFFSGFLRRRGMARLTASVTNATELISAALESGKGQSDNKSERYKDSSQMNSVSSDTRSAEAELQLRNFEAFSEEGLKALLADCYWAEQDRYAAFIWKEIPIGKRKTLISTLPFLKDYLSIIAALAPADLGLENDPYYLTPFEMHHLSNLSLTEFVRRSPHILKQLPQLRSDALELSIRERIEFERQTSLTDVGAPDFQTVPRSNLRKLKRKSGLKIRTIEDERELLNLSDPTIEIIESVQSLGWLLRLQASQIELILKSYSAKDLAQVWLAPEEILEQLQNLMPKSKTEMIKGYVQTHAPVREHPIMESIHEQTLLMLKEIDIPVVEEKAA